MEWHGKITGLTDLLSLSTMTIATSGADGQPHAAPVYFAADQSLSFFFFSDPQSQHSKDLYHDSRAAAAVYPECFDWQDIRGLQMHGQVNLMESGEDWEKAWEAYQTKFPFVSGIKNVLAQNRLYAFTPAWIRLVDNRRGFGFKQEWNLK